MITSIEKPQTEPPTHFALCQNYPNPFNAGTTIHFSLPQAGCVSLEIFNTRGEETATLVDGMQQAGDYEVRWSAANFPTGTYFYRLKMGTWVETKKLVLLR